MSTYVPRFTVPDVGDVNYKNINYGGNNRCIVRNTATGSVLPNCTGYAWGRCLELNGSSTLPATNASTWYANSPNYEHGREPKLGAVICYNGGYYGGAGHVAVVEQINDDGTILTSESNYSGGKYFFVVRTLSPTDNYSIYDENGKRVPVNFQGFIYLGDWESPDNPYNPDDPNPPAPSGKKRSIMILLLKKLKDKRGIKI